MMADNNFIMGDGGPMIVLQNSAIPQWQGAADFDNSLMNGGNVETDYDVICRSNDTGYVIQRYDKDMLVLDDSEWGASIFTVPPGLVAVVQQYVGHDSIDVIMKRVGQLRPSNSFPMKVQDSSLRLLVGAEDGEGNGYGFKDVPITPGIKHCDVFSSDELLVVIIKPV